MYFTLLSIAALLTVTALLAFFCIKYRVFSKVVVKQISLGSATLLFVPYQGNYRNAMQAIKRMKATVTETFKDQQVFFGIYYDNPAALANPDEARAILGAVVRDSVDLRGFLKAHPEYKTAMFKDLTGTGTEFLLDGQLSILVAVSKGYSRLMACSTVKCLPARPVCAMEVYDYAAAKMTILLPNTENNEGILYQSGYAVPAASISKKDA